MDRSVCSLFETSMGSSIRRRAFGRSHSTECRVVHPDSELLLMSAAAKVRKSKSCRLHTDDLQLGYAYVASAPYQSSTCITGEGPLISHEQHEGQPHREAHRAKKIVTKDCRLEADHTGDETTSANNVPSKRTVEDHMTLGAALSALEEYSAVQHILSRTVEYEGWQTATTASSHTAGVDAQAYTPDSVAGHMPHREDLGSYRSQGHSLWTYVPHDQGMFLVDDIADATLDLAPSSCQFYGDTNLRNIRYEAIVPTCLAVAEESVSIIDQSSCSFVHPGGQQLQYSRNIEEIGEDQRRSNTVGETGYAISEGISSFHRVEAYSSHPHPPHPDFQSVYLAGSSPRLHQSRKSEESSVRRTARQAHEFARRPKSLSPSYARSSSLSRDTTKYAAFVYSDHLRDSSPSYLLRGFDAGDSVGRSFSPTLRHSEESAHTYSPDGYIEANILYPHVFAHTSPHGDGEHRRKYRSSRERSKAAYFMHKSGTDYSRARVDSLNAATCRTSENKAKRTRDGSSQMHRRGRPLWWCKKVRKSRSLDNSTKQAGGSTFLHDDMTVESTAAMLQKPTCFSGSCPLPTTAFECLEDDMPPTRKLNDREAASLMHNMDIDDAVSLLQPTVRRLPFLRRIVLNRKMLFLTLVPVALLFSVILASVSRNKDSQGPAIVLGNYSMYRIREHSSPETHDDLSARDISTTCDTVACRNDGIYLKGLLAWDFNPCDDFYQFVCKRWKSTVSGSSFKKEEFIAAAYRDLTHQLEVQALHLLQRTESFEELSELRKIFWACMDTQELQKDSYSHMTELLWLSTLEGFPFTFSQRNSSSVWLVVAKLLRMTGIQTLVDIRMIPHPSADHESIPAVRIPELLSPYPDNFTKTSAFYNQTAYMAMSLLTSQHIAATLSEQVAVFAARLESLASNYSSSHCSSGMYSLKKHPDLLLFVNEMFSSRGSFMHSDHYTTVVVECSHYFNNISFLVANTRPLIVLNYLGIRLLTDMSAFVPWEGQVTQALVQHFYSEPRPFLPRWKLCLRMAERAAPLLFLHAVRIAQEHTAGLDSISHHSRVLVQQLTSSLDKLTVLDEGTKSIARGILNRTKIALFYPPWLKDTNKFNNYVRKLPRVIHGQGLLSFYKLRKHTVTERLRNNDFYWPSSAFQTDCHIEDQTIYLPWLMFNMTLVNFEGDESLMLPHAGARITQCLLRMMLRAINFNASQHSHSSWWPDLSHSLIGSTKLCFEQYADVPRASSQALLESTAALKPTLDLYLREKRLDTRFEMLRSYSVQHLFYVYYALGYCENSAINGSNAVTSLVNVPLWNNRMFQETFHCAVGTKMNPMRKCLLWKEA